MSRILLGWELGDGLGHVGRLLPIAQELRERGHECYFGLRNLAAAFPTLKSEGFRIFQAPYAIPLKDNRPIGSLGDILARIGFQDPQRLQPFVEGWSDLIDVLEADLVVADYSPALCLAAIGGTPVIAIGDAFTLPSIQGLAFPQFSGKRPATVEEGTMLAVVAEVQRRRGRPQPKTLPGIFGEAERFIVTLPELGSLGPSDDSAHVVGPLAPLPPPATTPPEMDYFAYLSMTAPGIAKALRALPESGLRGELFVRDASPGQRAELRRLGLTVHERPQPLAEAIGRARLLIHHGGLGTSEAGLAVGRPQLLIPRHQEQALNATQLCRLGLAVAMRTGGRYEGKHFLEALNHVHSEPKFAKAAKGRAGLIAARGQSGGLRKVVDACLTHLEGI